MKKNMFTALLLAGTLAGAPLYASTQGPGDPGTRPGLSSSGEREPGLWKKGRRGSGQNRFARMAQVLELTPEQQDRIRAIRAESREKTDPLREQMREYRQKIRDASRTEALDESVIRDLAAEQSEIRSELMVEKARMRSRIHALLTPEQREKAQELRSIRGERRNGRHFSR